MNISVETKQAYIDFIRDLYENDPFISDILDNPDHNNDSDSCDGEDFDSYTYACGASKGVIIPFNLEGYVIKFPFAYKKFDYCRAEWRNSVVFEQAGFGFAIAKTDFLCRLDNGYPIYIQEIAECSEDTVESSIFESCYENFKSQYIADWSDDGDMSEDDIRCAFWDDISDEPESYICDLFEDDYGVQTAAALDRLICDNHINDLHTGNVGYINNHIVLVDYSGYGYYAEQQDEDWYNVCA